MDYDKNTKHLGEQNPLIQDSEVAEDGQSDNANEGDAGNPIKPEETQKGIEPIK